MRRSTPSRARSRSQTSRRCHALGGGGQQPQPTEELKITQGVPSGASAETASDSSLLSVSGYFRTNQIKGGSLLVRLAPSLFPPLSVRGFTPILNANTWRDFWSASRVWRTTSASVGDTVIGCTSLVFRSEPPLAVIRIASTPDMSSRKRLRFFRATGRFLAAIVHLLHSWRRPARRASSASRAPFKARFSAALRSAISSLSKSVYQPDLSICRKLVVDHPGATTLAFPVEHKAQHPTFIEYVVAGKTPSSWPQRINRADTLSY